MKLYEIASSIKQLESYVDNYELTPEQEDKILELWKESDEQLEKKAHGIAVINSQLTQDIENIKSEIKRLTERKRILENKQTRLKSFIKDVMEFLKIDKIKTPLFSLSIRNNAESLEVSPNMDIEQLPINFLKIEYTVKKKEILDYYKQTGILPDGFSIKKTRSLVIK